MNIDTIKKYMLENGIDGWLLYDFWGINPLAQKILGTSNKAITRRYFYYIPCNGDPVGLVHMIDLPHFPKIEGEVRGYTTWYEMKDKLQTILGDAKTIAMEYSPQGNIPYISRVDAGTLELIQKIDKRVVSSADLLQLTISRWKRIGLKLHTEAAQKLSKIKDEAFYLIREKVRSKQKITEYEVQQFILKCFREQNLKTVYEPVVAVNENSGDPHYIPTKETAKSIKENCLVLIDLWAKENNEKAVFADITWMAYVGQQIPENIKKIFKVVTIARNAAIKFLKESLKEKSIIYGWQVDDVARRHISNEGYGKFFTHRTGHSLDQDLHGSGVNIDNFEIKDTRRILPGIGFTIEPGIYLRDFGIRSEVDIYIDENKEILITTPLQQSIIKL